MKHIVRNLSVLGCVGSSALAAPFLAIGNNAELFVTATGSAAYNDNILLGPSGSELQDTIFTLRPGFDLQFNKNATIQASLVGTATLTSYADNSSLNNQLLGIGSNASYDGGSLSLNANASFNQLDQATVDVVPTVGTLVEREVTAAGINGELAISEKISVGSGVSYSKTDYRTAGYADSEDYTVPVNVYYELTPKVDVSAGVRYTRTETYGAGADQYDAFYYNVGARGAFTPKLSGSFSVGYNMRSASVGSDDKGSIGAEASLAYAYTDKTQLTLDINRNFDNASVGGTSYENTAFTLGASSAIAIDWTLTASATYRILEYNTYTNTYIEGSLGASYAINSHLSAGLSYVYRQQTSDLGAGSEFNNNLITLSLSARY
ncbi:MAG: outer membrane beta-barrel protein [Opitutaceae bacterium]|jgi:hypothetical protein